MSSTARAAAQATGLPPKVVPWLPGCSRVAAAPRATVAPIGMPPPRPLARVTTSGAYAVEELVGEPGAGAADAGLHLVEPEQRAVLVGDALGGGEVAGARDDDAGLALDRLEDDGGDRVVDGGLERGHVVVRHEGDVAGQRLEGVAVGRLRGEREGAHRPAVEGALGGDEPGAAGATGQLEGGLVGLGAGVAEEDPASSVQPSRPRSRSARRPGARWRRSSRRGRGSRAGW